MNEQELNNLMKEVREDVLDVKPKPQSKRKKLINDGRQYSLRFPKKYVEEAEIDVENEEFEITLELPDPSKANGEKAQINIRLVRDE
jgi:hypothetical protein